MSQPLEYARRDQLDLRIERELIAQEQARRVGMWLRLAAGVPASFAAPFLITSVLFLLSLRFFVLLPFATTFALSSVVLVPLIYWRASRHRTDFFGEAAASLDISDPYRADSYGEMEMRSSVLSWSAYLDLFFWGPYLVLEAMETWRADQQALASSRDRACHILRELLAKESGVAPRTLQQPGEPDEQFRRAMRYLASHDWIDLSRRRDRVWLLSEGRERLTSPRA